MPIPLTISPSILKKIPQIPTPKVDKWPVPPLQGLVPPTVNPPNPCSEDPLCDCLCHQEISYPENCECKFMCENFFQQFTKVFGMFNAGINTIEDVTSQLDELHGTAFGGLKSILLKNPLVLPTLRITDDVMDTITSVTSPYTDPLDRISEILNGQGISDSCGWLACAFKGLRDALDLPEIPAIGDVGEDAVRDAVQGIEDLLNVALDYANDKILSGQKSLASAVLREVTEAGLDKVGVFSDLAGRAFDSVGLTEDVRSGLDDFASCILQSCNRTGCTYRKKFKDYIVGPKVRLDELALNPLIDLTEDVADFVDETLQKKSDINKMLANGASDVLDKVLPDPVLDCEPGRCRYCGPTCVSAHTAIDIGEPRYQTSSDEAIPSAGPDGEVPASDNEDTYPDAPDINEGRAEPGPVTVPLLGGF
jgi:hypothetical protein